MDYGSKYFMNRYFKVLRYKIKTNNIERLLCIASKYPSIPSLKTYAFKVLWLGNCTGRFDSSHKVLRLKVVIASAIDS